MPALNTFARPALALLLASSAACSSSTAAPAHDAGSQAPAAVVVEGKAIPVIKGTNAFGTGTRHADSLMGIVYFIPEGTTTFPDVGALDAAAVLFTDQLNVPPRDFQEGFPGVHDRFEWFAVVYDGRFAASAEGDYDFRILSDDGSLVYVDNKLVVNNDGAHTPQSRDGHITLGKGTHRIRVNYFQGPRSRIALQLFVTPPGGAERLFGPRF